MSERPYQPGEAYRTQPQDVVRAACPHCHLEFDQPLAEKTQRSVDRATEIQESAKIARLSKRINAAIVKEGLARTDAEQAALCRRLLEILRNEGIWLP
jgi:hypothetical protein